MKLLSNKTLLSILAIIGLTSCEDTTNQGTTATFESVRYEVECDYCWVQSFEYEKRYQSWSTVNYADLSNSFLIGFTAPEGQDVAGFTVNTARLVVDSVETFYRPGQNIDSLYLITDTVVVGNDTTYLIGDTLYLNSVTVHEKVQTVVGSIYVDEVLIHTDTLTGERLNFSL